MKYRTLVADPPWPYDNPDAKQIPKPVESRPNSWRRSGPAMTKHYAGLSLIDLAALRVPVETNAHLYLWTTNSFMVPAHHLAEAWGFKVKTICTWVKTHQNDSERVSMKTGYYFRGATEHFLFCVRGSLRLQTTEGLPTAYLWPRIGKHSQKPEAFYDLVEKASPGPYLEMFARRNRMGWSAWGDEAISDVEVSA